MILIVCSDCRLALRVLDTSEEALYLIGEKSEGWPKATCCRCGAAAQRLLEIEAEPRALSLLEVIDLTAKEAFMALNGLGLPTEQRCSLESVTTLLKEQPIRKVLGVDVPGTERCMLDHLELWDGTKVYLGASPHGAVVYRIAPPHSYTKMATDHAQ